MSYTRTMTLRTPVDLEEVARISRAHGVKRLRVFGSAVTDRFDPEQSDIDLLVEFATVSTDAFDTYFALKEELEASFSRPVDLVMADALRNPHFRAAALATAEDLYAA